MELFAFNVSNKGSSKSKNDNFSWNKKMHFSSYKQFAAKPSQKQIAKHLKSKPY
jgi:hypothetical protein